MFPESRLMLGMLGPVLGTFFGVCIYVTGVWQPSTAAIDLESLLSRTFFSPSSHFAASAYS